MNKIKQNYQNYFSLSNKKSCLILRIELCSLFMFRTPQALSCSLALLELRIAATHVRVCDGSAMNVR